MRAPGQVIGSFRLGALIGRGGMAEVWRAEHVALESQHAIKFLSLTTGVLEERLLLEGRTQAGLAHPNVVRVTEVVRDEDGVGLVMELVEGPTLEAWLEAAKDRAGADRATGDAAWAELEAIFLGICAGVRAAHARGIVHRDLKPANVLLARHDGTWVPKVSDFGIARVLDASQTTRTGAVLGTLRFASPEQLRDASRVDERTDIWALGCVLYEMLSGRALLPELDIITLHERLRDGGWATIDEVAPGAPAALRRAVTAAIRYDPADRPPSVEALMQLIRGPTGPLDPGARGLAGLRLVRRVGGSEGAEAWCAEAPDGSLVFVKFAPLSAPSEVRARIAREMRLGRELRVRGVPSGTESFDDTFRDEPVRGLRRPWIAGASLDEASSRRNIDADAALDRVDELLGILADLAVQSPPVVHREICPAHIVCSPTGLALVGLGRARDRMPDLDLGGATFVGVFGWQAPEQYAGDAHPTTDVYAAAILAVLLLTGKDPATLLDVRGHLAWKTLPGIPPAVGAALEGMLGPAPHLRPSAVEARQALARARGPSQRRASETWIPEEPPPWAEPEAPRRPDPGSFPRAGAVLPPPAAPSRRGFLGILGAVSLGAVLGVGALTARAAYEAPSGARGDRPYGFWLLPAEACAETNVPTDCDAPAAPPPTPRVRWTFDGPPSSWEPGTPALTAGMRQTDGMVGDALAFGEDHAAAISALPTTETRSPAFTISLWYRLVSECHNDMVTLFSDGVGAPAATGVHIGVLWRGQAVALLGAGKTTTMHMPASPLTRCMDSWSQIALTFALGETVLYEDGVESVRTTARFPQVVHGEAPVTLGGQWDTQVRQLQGAIDEVRIYDRALTPDEVAAAHHVDVCSASAAQQ